MFEGGKVVDVDDLVGDFVEFDLHVFKTVHGRSVVKFRNVGGCELGAGCGNCAVDEELRGGYACTLQRWVFGVVELVSANCKAYAVGLDLGQADGTLLLTISDFSSLWYLGVGGKKMVLVAVTRSSFPWARRLMSLA